MVPAMFVQGFMCACPVCSVVWLVASSPSILMLILIEVPHHEGIWHWSIQHQTCSKAAYLCIVDHSVGGKNCSSSASVLALWIARPLRSLTQNHLPVEFADVPDERNAGAVAEDTS